MQFDIRVFWICFFVLALSACDRNSPVTNDRYHSSDELWHIDKKLYSATRTFQHPWDLSLKLDTNLGLLA